MICSQRGKKNRIFYYDGHNYHRDKRYVNPRTHKELLYLKCEDYSKSLCKGRAALDLKTDKMMTTKIHDCKDTKEDDKNGMMSRRFVHACKVASSISTRNESIAEIYYSTQLKYPEYCTLNYPLSALLRSLQHERAARYPKDPSTASEAIREYDAAIRLPVIPKFAENYHSGGRCSDGSHYMLFLSSADEVKKVLRDGETLSVDGTFRTAPRSFFQVINFFIDYKLEVVFVASAILTGKSQIVYTDAIKAFRAAVSVRCRPLWIMTDWEQGLRNALKTVYPEAHQRGCHFHYCQVSLDFASK
jgi:hypothetical protein